MNSNRKDRFPNFIRDLGGGCPNPYEFRILSFDGSHDVELILLRIDKIDKLFDMEYIIMEDQVEFVAHRLKGRIAVWWDQFQNMCMYQESHL